MLGPYIKFKLDEIMRKVSRIGVDIHFATANLGGNTGTPDFDVFPGRLCGRQISERFQGNL